MPKDKPFWQEQSFGAASNVRVIFSSGKPPRKRRKNKNVKKRAPRKFDVGLFVIVINHHRRFTIGKEHPEFERLVWEAMES